MGNTGSISFQPNTFNTRMFVFAQDTLLDSVKSRRTRFFQLPLDGSASKMSNNSS